MIRKLWGRRKNLKSGDPCNGLAFLPFRSRCCIEVSKQAEKKLIVPSGLGDGSKILQIAELYRQEQDGRVIQVGLVRRPEKESPSDTQF